MAGFVPPRTLDEAMAVPGLDKNVDGKLSKVEDAAMTGPAPGAGGATPATPEPKIEEQATRHGVVLGRGLLARSGE